MSRYYCPYCSSLYQIHKTRSDGVLICGLCGDPLISKNLFISRKIIGIVALTAFLMPLLIMIILIIQDLSEKKTSTNFESLALLTLDKSWER